MCRSLRSGGSYSMISNLSPSLRLVNRGRGTSGQLPPALALAGLSAARAGLEVSTGSSALRSKPSPAKNDLPAAVHMVNATNRRGAPIGWPPLGPSWARSDGRGRQLRQRAAHGGFGQPCAAPRAAELRLAQVKSRMPRERSSFGT